MKKLALTTVWLLTMIIFLYLPLSFAALSFNPFEWSHMERFIFGFLVWLMILFIYVLPKTKYANLKV